VRALLIGCGNIGALYDIEDSSKIWTHAKAYARHPEISLTVTDQDWKKAEAIATAYNAEASPEEEIDYKNFDLISITTPTPSHFHFLKKSMEASVPVIICEKPLVHSIGESEELEKLYAAHSSKVLVNYIRRFQPGYRQLKGKLKQYAPASYRGMIIKYKRGFLNNASHAVDLVEFLFDQKFGFENFHVQQAVFDAFDYDPTLTASCGFMGQPVSFAGFADAAYPIFEIELFFQEGKIVICHSGNDIRYYVSEEGGLKEMREERQTGILDHYMVPVVEEALDLFHKRKLKDNFADALHLNQGILKIIDPIKK
jgi:predicted dehydrogenase